MARPFKLRVMQEFTRSSIVISAPARALYLGNVVVEAEDRQPKSFCPGLEMAIAAGEIIAGIALRRIADFRPDMGVGRSDEIAAAPHEAALLSSGNAPTSGTVQIASLEGAAVSLRAAHRRHHQHGDGGQQQTPARQCRRARLLMNSSSSAARANSSGVMKSAFFAWRRARPRLIVRNFHQRRLGPAPRAARRWKFARVCSLNVLDRREPSSATVPALGSDMVQRVSTVAFEGIEVRPVDVQVQVAPGMPAFTIVRRPARQGRLRGPRAGALGDDRIRAGVARPPHHHQSRARRSAEGRQPLRSADRARADGGDRRHSA